jgi:hypothetical protein
MLPGHRGEALSRITGGSPLNDYDVLTHQGKHKNRQEQKAEGNEFGIEGHNMLSTPQGQPPVHSIATAI